MSAVLSFVSTRSRCIKSRSTQSHRRKYLISICLVLVVGFCALPIAVHASLSSCITVAASCGMSRSQRMLRTYNIIFPVSYAAMNSASVEEPAIVGWNLHLYAIVPPAKRKQAPPKEPWVLGQVAQSESAYACSMLASYSGQASVSSKSCLLLWTGRRGPSLNSGCGVIRQKYIPSSFVT